MRLLDRVARCHAPLHLALDGAAALPFEVTGASQYASRVADCPLRFVLNDDLTRASAELAFADGARLAGCLDLLRVPAPRLWVEWNDAVHQQVIYETGTVTEYDAAASGRRVGVLLQGSADGHHSIARTFWVDAAADESAEVVLSPLETHIDLRGGHSPAADPSGVLAGGFVALKDTTDAAMTSLLDHVKFRFDEPWAAYYRAAAANPEAQRHVVHGSRRRSPAMCPCCWRSFYCCPPRTRLVRCPSPGRRSIANGLRMATRLCSITSKCAPRSMRSGKPIPGVPNPPAGSHPGCITCAATWCDAMTGCSGARRTFAAAGCAA